MKRHFLCLIGAVGVACLAASCATAYDAQGRQVQVVTPEGAAASAWVEGLIGYAITDNHKPKHYGNHGDNRGYGSYGGYSGYSGRGGNGNHGGDC